MANEKKGCKKAGRNIERCSRYSKSDARYKNKIKRIARSNGFDHALEYADAHMLRSWTRRELKSYKFRRTEDL